MTFAITCSEPHFSPEHAPFWGFAVPAPLPHVFFTQVPSSSSLTSIKSLSKRHLVRGAFFDHPPSCTPLSPLLTALFSPAVLCHHWWSTYLLTVSPRHCPKDSAAAAPALRLEVNIEQVVVVLAWKGELSQKAEDQNWKFCKEGSHGEKDGIFVILNKEDSKLIRKLPEQPFTLSQA